MEQQTERFIALETRISYLEDFVDRLQAIVVEHSGEVDRLKAENRALRSKFTDLEQAVQDMPDQRPPHY